MEMLRYRAAPPHPAPTHLLLGNVGGPRHLFRSRVVVKGNLVVVGQLAVLLVGRLDLAAGEDVDFALLQLLVDGVDAVVKARGANFTAFVAEVARKEPSAACGPRETPSGVRLPPGRPRRVDSMLAAGVPRALFHSLMSPFLLTRARMVKPGR